MTLSFVPWSALPAWRMSSDRGQLGRPDLQRRASTLGSPRIQKGLCDQGLEGRTQAGWQGPGAPPQPRLQPVRP